MQDPFELRPNFKHLKQIINIVRTYTFSLLKKTPQMRSISQVCWYTQIKTPFRDEDYERDKQAWMEMGLP